MEVLFLAPLILAAFALCLRAIIKDVDQSKANPRPAAEPAAFAPTPAVQNYVHGTGSAPGNLPPNALTTQEAYDMLISGSFGLDMNANDMFHRSTAMSVSIDLADVRWVVEHVRRWGQDGIDSAMAYIQNTEPLPEYLTPGFLAAMEQLVSSGRRVAGDVDHAAHGYDREGPYRSIDPRWVDAAPVPAPGCRYDVCWRGPCGQETAPGLEYCPEHLDIPCHKCGGQASGDCHGYNGSFVCGMPTCPDHRHRH